MIQHEIASFSAGKKDFKIIRCDDDAYEIEMTVWDGCGSEEISTTMNFNREQLELFVNVVSTIKDYFKREDSKA